MILSKKDLSEALALVAGILPRKANNPILTYIQLKRTPDSLVLAGSNGEIDLEVRLPVAGLDTPDRRLVPALFADLVRSLPGATVELDLGAEVGVRSGGANARLLSSSPEGAPDPWADLPMEEALAVIPAAGLLELLAVRQVSSTEEYRAIFQGVQLEFFEHRVKAVASDGYCLVEHWLDLPCSAHQIGVVPRKTAHALARIVQGQGEVRLWLHQNRLTVRAGEVRATMTLMEGRFPDYQRVVPQSFVGALNINRNALHSALRRVSQVGDRTYHRVDLMVQADRVVVASEGDYGSAEEEIAAEYSATPLTLAYNAEHLIQILEVMSGDSVIIRFSGPTSASLIEGEGSRAVVVPLSVTR